jgi:hypothetical protein
MPTHGGNFEEAEDLIQGALRQSHREIATFYGDSIFSTWLHRLAINVALMHLRRKGLPPISLGWDIEPAFGDGPRRNIVTSDLTHDRSAFLTFPWLWPIHPSSNSASKRISSHRFTGRSYGLWADMNPQASKKEPRLMTDRTGGGAGGSGKGRKFAGS